MEAKELTAMIEDIFTKCKKVMEGKGHDYTAGDSDRLINFKSVANRTGVDPLVVWGIYFNKHVDSINTLVKTGRQESGEPVEGRIIDIINYALLGLALIKESEQGRMVEVTDDSLDWLRLAAELQQGPCPPGRED